jgi:hypothetical protein
VREFGKLEFIALNALAFVALTGNGLVLAEDLVRRFISTQLDARMEDPEQRRFAVNILAEVKGRRAELLTALLTIWRCGRVAGSIEQGKPLGSYEQWCSWVRDPLVAVGCTDPVERVGQVKRRDPGRQAIVTLFDVWWEHHADRPVTANDLHEEVKRLADSQGRGRQYLAAYFERLAGTRLGGYVLTRQAPPGKWGAATYALKRTDPDAPYAPYASRHRWPEKNRGEDNVYLSGDLGAEPATVRIGERQGEALADQLARVRAEMAARQAEMDAAERAAYTPPTEGEAPVAEPVADVASAPPPEVRANSENLPAANKAIGVIGGIGSPEDENDVIRDSLI